MERQSPPTDRVVRVLNLLAAEPSRRFSLAELAHRLGIPKATCLGIAGALVRASYLLRDEDTKTYRLGPALLTLGRATQASVVSLELARPKLLALTERFGHPCTASTVIGDDLVVLERTGLAGSPEQTVVGQRYPYAPPSGVVFAVWQSDQAIEQWLTSYPQVPVDRNRVDALARSCRKLGYIVERLSDVSVGSFSLLAGLSISHTSPEVTDAFNTIVAAFPERYYLEEELDADEFAISDVCAVTYSAHGTPELLLGMFILGTIGRDELFAIAQGVRDAAIAVTAEVGGHNPWA